MTGTGRTWFQAWVFARGITKRPSAVPDEKTLAICDVSIILKNTK